MLIKVRRFSREAVIPKRATPGSAGVDLTAVAITGKNELFVEYSTGLSFEIPSGHVGLLFPRSSISSKGWYLSNSTGVIDSDYRGDLKVRFSRGEGAVSEHPYEVGDRIAQLLVVPCPDCYFIESETLEITDRGDGGFGSTGV